jgi:LacI family transcriptional regulator
MLYTISNLKTSPVVVLQLGKLQLNADIIKNAVSEYGWKLFNIESDFPKGMKPIGAFLNNGDNEDLIKRLKEINCPIIQLANSFPNTIEGAYTVGADLTKAGALAAKYFSDRGFKSFAFVGNEPWGAMKATYEEYNRLAESLNCQCELFQINSRKIYEESPIEISEENNHYNRIVNWLKSLKKPVAMLAYNDYFASKLSYYCTEAGLNVPEEVAILGMGNEEFMCEASCVPISSIEMPWDKIWRKAFSILNEIHSGKVPAIKNIYFPYEKVIERDSTNVMALDDLVVLKSLQYIWDNYDKNIGTRDIADSLNVHRSTLERRFKRSLGRTVNEEIRRKRIEAAEGLLTKGNESVANIATKVGFNSKNHFYDAFRKKHGVTPAVFRLKTR